MIRFTNHSQKDNKHPVIVELTHIPHNITWGLRISWINVELYNTDQSVSRFIFMLTPYGTDSVTICFLYLVSFMTISH